MQTMELFGDEILLTKDETAQYGHSAGSHKRVREEQAGNTEFYHHPQEKIAHLERLREFVKGDILEVFAGKGNLTKWYATFGKVTAMTKEEFGSSFDAIYQLRADRQTFDVIDIDSYGYPDLFFPTVFELMKDSTLLIFTFPIVGINCLNGIMEQHFISFWRSARPTIGDVVGTLTDMALRTWQLPQLLSVHKIQRIWRFAFLCQRQSATDMCNVRNH
jgi:hypothetical protein